MSDLISRGGPLMYPLLLCSVVSLAVTVERIIFWWREVRRRDEPGVQRLLSHADSGRDPAGTDLLGENPGYVARVLHKGLDERDHGLRESMEAAAQEELSRMKRGLGVLHTIVALAPLLGILGTVLGIIDSFDMLGSSGIEDPRAVTGGIAQALVTTAAGLSVAIVTVIPYEYFKSRVNKAAERMSLAVTRFEVALRKGERDAD